ncbi:ADP-ribosylation factor GTPase-activating protein AGD12-like [Hibiscus syriacus]|uniref:ADP-ribosylation factor GTPase-activating protein AGD12-like n=1 Tax=Hibiscus syriacus TaxID=106335 RepID=UPI001920B511|nr:ADP-ribosylation factor GTPase-activating protein AGD12-like [Hibiscus syriacus]
MFGVFICLKCCGVHRSLGARISKILSVALAEWSDEDTDYMIEVGGNPSANAICEAYIPEGYSKPGPDGSHDERRRFIRLEFRASGQNRLSQLQLFFVISLGLADQYRLSQLESSLE